MADRRRPAPPLGAAARRRRPARERLSTDRVVDVALQQMRDRGYEGVSMRSIARELGTGPASLYAHVANREELDQLVLDRIASMVPLPEPDPARWKEQLKETARATLEVFRQHPGSARSAIAVIPTEEGGLHAAENMLAICLAGGVTPQAAAWFCDLLPLYVCAVAYEESVWVQRENTTAAGEEPDHPAIDALMKQYFESLSPEEYPNVTGLAWALMAGDGDDRFEFGLDVLVAGLEAVSDRYATD